MNATSRSPCIKKLPAQDCEKREHWLYLWSSFPLIYYIFCLVLSIILHYRSPCCRNYVAGGSLTLIAMLGAANMQQTYNVSWKFWLRLQLTAKVLHKHRNKLGFRFSVRTYDWRRVHLFMSAREDNRNCLFSSAEIMEKKTPQRRKYGVRNSFQTERVLNIIRYRPHKNANDTSVCLVESECFSCILPLHLLRSHFYSDLYFRFIQNVNERESQCDVIGGARFLVEHSLNLEPRSMWRRTLDSGMVLEMCFKCPALSHKKSVLLDFLQWTVRMANKNWLKIK